MSDHKTRSVLLISNKPAVFSGVIPNEASEAS